LHARVSVSVLPSDRGALSVAALRSAAGFLRSSLRDSTTLRRVPELAFELRSSLTHLGLDSGAGHGVADAADGDDSDQTDHSRGN
jgi:hypothetical protein